MKQPKHPAIVYVLKALVPYSKEGALLAFKPNRFFNELERLSGYKNNALRSAFYRAERAGLIQTRSRGTPFLTLRGRERLQPFVATRLTKGGKLMVIFDIPEDNAALRRQLRGSLRKLEFEQIQQSVWMTKYDHRQILEEIIDLLGLHDCVQLYEAARIFPR